MKISASFMSILFLASIGASAKSPYHFLLERTYSSPGRRLRAELLRETLRPNLSDNESYEAASTAKKFLELHLDQIFDVVAWANLSAEAEEFWKSLGEAQNQNFEAARVAYVAGRFSADPAKQALLVQKLDTLRSSFWSFLSSSPFNPMNFYLPDDAVAPKISPFLNQLMHEAWALASFYEDLDRRDLGKLKVKVIPPKEPYVVPMSIIPDTRPYVFRSIIVQKLEVLWKFQSGNCGQNGLWPRAAQVLDNFLLGQKNDQVLSLMLDRAFSQETDGALMHVLRDLTYSGRRVNDACLFEEGLPRQYDEDFVDVIRFYRYLGTRSLN
jgi:hypothetical protein